MTYKKWLKHGAAILREAEQYNEWREHAKHNLLTVVAPKIAELGNKGYHGCGFHYSLEQDLGKLISYLSMPWQPCANHANKVEDAVSLNCVHQGIYKYLIEKLENIDKSFKV